MWICFTNNLIQFIIEWNVPKKKPQVFLLWYRIYFGCSCFEWSWQSSNWYVLHILEGIEAERSLHNTVQDALALYL